MKILEINKYYFRKGGTDKYFLDVIDLLEKNGHEVAVFSMHSRYNGETPWKQYFLSEVGYTSEFPLAQKIRGACRMFYSREAKRKINQLLDVFQPDVVHVHNIYHQLSPLILFEIKKRKIPVVMTVHDFKLISPNYNLFLHGRPYTRCQGGKFYQCLLDKCVKNSYVLSFLAMLEMYWHEILGTYRKNIDLFIAPSLFVKKTLVEWGMEAEKIVVLPHFIPAVNSTTVLPNMVAREKYALYAGRISENKGVSNLIRAFQKISGMKLYLAGNPEDGFVIPEAENIKYLGFLSPRELQNVISQACVIVSGSKLPETFGLVALEAIAQGKPFVGFKTGAFGEIIENGRNGYLARTDAEFRSRINEMAEGKLTFDSKLIQEEALKHFSGQKYEKNLVAIFKEGGLIPH